MLAVRFQHPVYCMRVVGTQNAHNLISVSTDGKMCSWSLDMLSQPQVRRHPLTCLVAVGPTQGSGICTSYPGGGKLGSPDG